MRFYYMSVFSLIFLAVLYLVALGIFWFVWSKILKRKFSGPVVWTVIAVVLVAPWTEELWIAYQFGQLCRKDAGVFINKTVEVEGFYDNTTGWGARQLAESKYQFVESKDVLYKKLSRVERADNVARDRALAWYAEKNQGKERQKDYFVVHPVNDEEQIVVSPNDVDAWRITKLAYPTAQYHYKRTHDLEKVAHKIKKDEKVVLDITTGEILGRETTYTRGPYWFFIHLDRPVIFCPASGERSKDPEGMLYQNVLLSKRKIQQIK